MASFKLKAELKGFYYSELEIDILKEIGFKFKWKKHKSGRYEILENPEPIRATPERIIILKQYDFMPIEGSVPFDNKEND